MGDEQTDDVGGPRLRFATWNIDSVRARADQILEWLAYRQPDVCGLQETKCPDRQFPVSVFRAAGYEVVHHGPDHLQGVALLSRVGIDDVSFGYPWELPKPFHEARLLSATCAGIRTHVAYAPNGKRAGTTDHAFKLAWLEALRLLVDDEDHREVIIAGDLNVAPGDADVHDPHHYRKRNLTSPPERAAIARLLDDGYHDVIREQEPSRLHGPYTWWNRRSDFFATDRGWRLDLLLVSDALAPQVVAAAVDRDERAKPNCSDHAPVWLDLTDLRTAQVVD